MPSEMASGMAMAAVRPARTSVFLSRGPMISTTRRSAPGREANELPKSPCHRAAEPVDVAFGGRLVEPDLLFERGHRFGRCGLAENRSGEVARQQRDDPKISTETMNSVSTASASRSAIVIRMVRIGNPIPGYGRSERFR
jgi:hypothetical protein